MIILPITAIYIWIMLYFFNVNKRLRDTSDHKKELAELTHADYYSHQYVTFMANFGKLPIKLAPKNVDSSNVN